MVRIWVLDLSYVFLHISILEVHCRPNATSFRRSKELEQRRTYRVLGFLLAGGIVGMAPRKKTEICDVWGVSMNIS
jgi:hypothetical protein